MSMQEWNADAYQEHASFVPTLGQPVLQLLNPKAGELILDLGCGDGALTESISKITSVYGIDASPHFVRKTQERGLQAEVMDGQALTFDNKFDAVFSNAALHWMKDYKRVLQGVYRALKKGGRFVGEFGGHGNIHHLISAMEHVFAQNPEFGPFVSPWFFPTPEFYQAELESCGFTCTYIEKIPRPTPLESGVRHWLNIFADFATSSLSQAQKHQFFEDCEHYLKTNYLKTRLYDEAEGCWVADYVRLRFSAVKG